MGNILSLQRLGLHNNNTYDAIDDLSYTYNGNQVIRIDDDAEDPVYNGCFNFNDGADEDTEYEYDGNGNLTMDLNRDICSIEYNCLNLPERIDYQDGSYVLYTYNAGGEKLRTDYYINPLPAVVPQVSGGTGMNRNANLQHTRVDYCGNLVYENDTLKQVLFEGGYVTFNGSSPQYHFYVQDHLGNNRVVCNASGTIEQVNHYYPFGGLMGESTNDEVQRYKYNGKELDRMHGLNWYDYHARQHDGAAILFTSMDSKCENYYHISPYVYCMGNPVMYVDPDGEKPRLYIDTSGLGHTFVTVGEGKNTVVYTYGRYGALGSSGSLLRSLTPTGEGVLYKKSGKDAYEYIRDNLTNKNLNIYTINDADDKMVSSYFDKQWKTGSQSNAKGRKAATDPDAKVIDSYNLFYNNCTTKSIEAINNGSEKEIVPSVKNVTNVSFSGNASYNAVEKIYSPRELNNILNQMSKTSSGDIIKVTNTKHFFEKLKEDFVEPY